MSARTLAKTVTQAKPGSSLRMGTVTAYSAGPPRTVTATVGGQSIAGIPILDHVAVSTGNAVWFMKVGPGKLLGVGSIDGDFQTLNGTGEATLTDGTGVLQVGPSGSANLGFDQNEIQARNSGAAAQLDLNPHGGLVQAGAGGLSTTGDVTAENDIYVGRNGGGDSLIHFYDDNSDTWRTLRWDDSANDWVVEDNGGVARTLWHAGNDGAGSGLDADTVDTYQPSAGSSPPSGAQLIRSHTNGYTYLGWLNTVSGSQDAVPSRIYCSTDQFVRYQTLANFRKNVASHIQFCNPVDREYDNNTTAFTAGTWYTVTLSATVGGVAMTNATGVFANITVVDPDGAGDLEVRRYGDSEGGASLINYDNTSGPSAWPNSVMVGIDSSRRFQFKGNTNAFDRLIVDVFAVIF